MSPFTSRPNPLAMASEKKSFINVDELMPQVSLEQAASFYGATLPELHRLGSETRAKCFLNCGRTQETGDRVLAIQDAEGTGYFAERPFHLLSRFRRPCDVQADIGLE